MDKNLTECGYFKVILIIYTPIKRVRCTKKNRQTHDECKRTAVMSQHV